MHKSYYAIIPADVRYDKKLQPNAKLLYGEITALCNEKGYCWAGNAYFSDLYGVSDRTIRMWINSLEESGYIKRKIIRNASKQVEQRIITIDTGKNLPHPPEEKFLPLGKNLPHPPEEKFRKNNTSINNTNNIPYVEIVTYLNDAAHKNFRPNTKATQRLIKARWNEGFRLKDFQTVIDKKTAEWLHDTKMNQYLRPETLFGTKFESYLNQDYVTGDSNTPTRPKEFEYDINAGED